MAEIKLTKNELKTQQINLQQLERYLPTLQLKKSLLQSEVVANRSVKESLQMELDSAKKNLDEATPLLLLEPSFSLDRCLEIVDLQIGAENIAGAELPVLTSIRFKEVALTLFDTPPWADSLIEMAKTTKAKETALEIQKQRLTILERELNDVSTRVNLFEKRLIPQSKNNIKKIKIFLGDMQLAAVSQAKVAKAKIIGRLHAH